MTTAIAKCLITITYSQSSMSIKEVNDTVNDMVNSVLGLADKIRLIDRVRSRLFADPDAAMSKLADVIDIIIKNCDTLYNTLEKLSSLKFDDEQNLALSKSILYSVKAKQLYEDLHKSREHCAKIEPIYKNHLNGWFSRVFKKDSNDYFELNRLFTFELTDTDGNVLKAIEKLNNFAENYANEILNYIERPDPDLTTAKAKVDMFNQATSEMRTKINEKVNELTDLRDEFTRKSGKTGNRFFDFFKSRPHFFSDSSTEPFENDKYEDINSYIKYRFENSKKHYKSIANRYRVFYFIFQAGIIISGAVIP